MEQRAEIVIVMGVSGAGKTSLGRALATALGWRFVEGDDYHPIHNVEMMAAGIPLTDRERTPWLQALCQEINGLQVAGQSAVITCSALKQTYRAMLRAQAPEIEFVYLHGPPALLEQRLQRRQGHFMGANLLASQWADLDIPSPKIALRLDAAAPIHRLVQQVCEHLGHGPHSRAF
jgi:carbohydrate kinase (thermoresistant glucokinase family)